MTNNYPSNSHKSKETRPPVVERAATKMKTSKVLDIVDTFLGDDIETIKKRVMEQIIIPGIKGAVLGTIETIFGMRGATTKASTINQTPYYTYSTSASRVQNVQDANYVMVNRASDYSDPVVYSVREANDILAEMNEILKQYHFVTIAQLYNACKIPSVYTHNNYGWIDLSNVQIVGLHDGRYRIKMPRPIPIE